MKMFLKACTYVLMIFVFHSFLYAANDDDTLTIYNQPSNALSVFGSRPDYSAGIKPTMIVDEFATIDHSLTEIRKQQIKDQISMWRTEGISYGTYYGFQNIESILNDSVDKGEDLDGSTLNINPITRQDQQDYLINSGKLAIDLGSEYIFLDVAIIGFFDSFDEETIESFRVYLSDNYTTSELTAMGVTDIFSFDYAQYLRDEGYSSIGELQNSTPNDLLWKAWEQYHLDFERYWFGKWGDTLRNYAQSEYNRNVYLGGNRYVYGSNKQWYVADLLDYTLAETFLDELGYPYHTLTFAYKTSIALGKRFWSWNFPANTATLNGTGDIWNQTITKLDGLFAAETFANGGLAQVPMGWKQYQDGQRVDDLVPFYRFVLAHSELYNHNHKGDVAVIYSEPGESIDPGTQGRSFRGAVEMLDQVHITYDIIFAGGKNTIDTLTLASLSSYNTVILPNTRYLSDNQVSVLEQYLTQGGTLVGIGIIGDQNEKGEFVSRSFTGIFTDGVQTVNGGTVITSTDDLFYEHYMAYDGSEAGKTGASGYRTDFESLIFGHVARDIFTSMPETVHLTRYIDSTDQSHIYHFVNYDYDMSTYDVNAVQDSTVLMAVPEGFDASSLVISLMSPENPDPEILTPSVDTGYATFTVPEINTWAIIKIGAAAEQAIIIDDAPQSMMSLNEFYGGHRPDEKNETGDFSYNYWYWKDHTPGQSDSIPYLATDDLELSKVELYYRFSTDYANWTDWALTDSVILSDTCYINSAFYVKNLNGDGYYQYQTRAVDSSGQAEIGDFIDELGHGIDTTKPEAPAIAIEINGVQNNVSQSEISTPTFTWTMPDDNLSGTQWVNIEFRKIPSWEFVAGAYNISTDDTTFSPGELEYGNYILTMKGQDYAGNWADESTIFTFIYEPPSGDIEVTGNKIIITNNDYTPEIADDTDFGEMRYQGDNVIHTFTIKNLGSLDLNLTEAITISNSPIFSVTQPNKTLLEPSDSTQFQVTCNPLSKGQYNANVRISSDDPDENPFTFEVFGQVIIPTLTVTADNKSRGACAVNPDFTIIYDGFLGSDDESVLTILPVASCTADESSAPGEYEIVVTGGSCDTYDFSYVSGTLTITPDVTDPELSVIDTLVVTLDVNSQAIISAADVVENASDNCGIVDTSLSQSTFSVNDLGTIPIDVTVSDGNGNSTSLTTIIKVNQETTIGVNDLIVDGIKIYPNPTAGLIILDFTDNTVKNIDVVNMIGNSILQISTDKKSETINLSEFDSGMYIIQVQCGEHTLIQRITKF